MTIRSHCVAPLLTLIEGTTGLEVNQAKTVVYFALATHGLPHLNKFPILTLYGPAGTGKTTLLGILKEIAHRPSWIDGKVSKAELRDSLDAETTALIDEADNVAEPWLVNRYSRQSASTSVKRERLSGWERESLNLFGATALHRRRPFQDPAILSRSIVISTIPKAGGVRGFTEEDFRPFRHELATIASDIDWDIYDKASANRISDTWEPLLWVAACLEDSEWQRYAEQEKRKAASNLSAGQEEEPSQAVYEAFLALALESRDGEPKERVLLSTVVRNVAPLKLNSWQVGQILRDLGFETKKVGGRQYVYTGGTESLTAIGRKLDLDDEWLKAQPPGK